MILTIKNQTGSPLSYLNGLVTVTANGQSIVPRDFNVLICADGQFLSDIRNSNIFLNTGIDDLNTGGSTELVKYLGQFSLEPLATLPLYYSMPVNIRQSAATTAGSTVWSMRNAANSIKMISIESIILNLSFDAPNPLVRNLLRYELIRFNTAAPSGGTSITPIKMDNLAESTTVTDARFLDTGLTVTSVVFETAFAIVSIPSITGSTAHYIRNIPIKLAAGEGLAIRLSENAIAGMGICGEIIWGER